MNTLKIDLTKKEPIYYWNDVERPFSHISGCKFDKVIIVENVILTQSQ